MDALLTEDKSERPLASQVLQLYLVKEKAEQIIKSSHFKIEMFNRLTNKLTLGWAGQEDIAKYQQLWMKHMGNAEITMNPNEVRIMIEAWAE